MDTQQQTYNMVFRRHEKKYYLSQEQYLRFQEAIEPYMKVDEYGKTTICNLYYDTEQFDLIRSSIERPIYKEKLRLRSYGIPKEEDTVFLEIKKKYEGIVYKRRVALSLSDAYQSIRQGMLCTGDGQITREINYFLSHYHPIPQVYLAYERIAMSGQEGEEELRMTFDFAIRSRDTELDLLAGDAGELLLPDGDVLLEIKVQNAYPFWLVQILEEIEIYPISFSKYGRVYQKLQGNQIHKKEMRIPYV